MHGVAIRREIVERVLARRGRLHLFDRLDAQRTALVVIDMQNAFVAPGAPVEVPRARDIVPAINRLAAELRSRGVPVIWVLHQNAGRRPRLGALLRRASSRRRIARAPRRRCRPATRCRRLWPELDGRAGRRHGRPRTATARSSPAPRRSATLLRATGIDTLLIAGTKTNVCCECTARDAMMLDYKVVMLSDCTAALSDDEHLATLENVIQQFGDVMSADEALRTN